jgi:hypothetical protein
MTARAYPLHLPENASPGHCIATFSTAITSMAIELGTFVDSQMRHRYGDSWFSALESKRKSESPKYKRSFSCYDFSWLFTEPTRNPDSPLRALLPAGDKNLYDKMDSLRGMRNRWYHDHNPHNISELVKTLDLVSEIAAKCGLELAENLRPVIQRVQDIKNGSYKSPLFEKIDEEPESSSTNQKTPMKQVAVGAKWIGALGSQKLELKPSGVIVDLVEATNVSSQLTDLQRSKYLPLWKKLELDWLWVDANGAVAAYVEGDLLMVGEFGEQAVVVEQDPFSKFLLNNCYMHSSDSFFEVESSLELEVAKLDDSTKDTVLNSFSAVEENEVMRLTWDGDLICFAETGPIYIGTVNSEFWFPGHFLLPTNHPVS